MTAEERESLILSHMPIVDVQVAKLVRAGLPRRIDPAELAQVGYLEMVRTIENSTQQKIPLSGEVAAHVRRELVRFLEREALWRERNVLIANYEEIASDEFRDW